MIRALVYMEFALNMAIISYVLVISAILVYYAIRLLIIVRVVRAKMADNVPVMLDDM